MFYTNKEICESLSDKSADEIISELFEHYRINCMNMFKIDSQRMDWLIDNLKNGCENREEAINIINGFNPDGSEFEQLPF